MIRTIFKLFAVFMMAISLHNGALAEGDAKKGERVYKKCRACHQVGEGAQNKVGPQLNNIFGRVPGSLEDFKYSSAMKAYGEGKVWDDATMTAFLTKPKAEVKGTKMAFPGLRKEADIANILAYLKTYQTEAAE